MKHEHACRNEELCSQLLSENKYYDWVVTTAFYSSIHFIDHKLFPLNHKGKTFADINEASNFIGHTKHGTRSILVNQHLPKQKANFTYLLKNCHTARYINYKIAKSTAEKAKDMLTKIKEECTTT